MFISVLSKDPSKIKFILKHKPTWANREEDTVGEMKMGGQWVTGN